MNGALAPGQNVLVRLLVPGHLAVGLRTKRVLVTLGYAQGPILRLCWPPSVEVVAYSFQRRTAIGARLGHSLQLLSSTPVRISVNSYVPNLSSG